MSLKLIVTFNVKAEKVDTMLSLLQGAKTALGKEPGCHGVEVLQNVKEPCQILLVEVWDSQEIHDAYAEKMGQAGSMESLGDFLISEPISEFFHIC